MAQLLRYPADVAGGIMQTEYVAVPEGARVEQAIEMIRNNVDEVSDLHSVFIIDQDTHLVGVLPLRKLILARATDLVEQIMDMDRQVISVRVDLDQEEVAQVCKKYDLVSLPVVDIAFLIQLWIVPIPAEFGGLEVEPLEELPEAVADLGERFVERKMFAEVILPLEPQVFCRVLFRGVGSKQQTRHGPLCLRYPRIFASQKLLHLGPPVIAGSIPQV